MAGQGLIADGDSLRNVCLGVVSKKSSVTYFRLPSVDIHDAAHPLFESKRQSHL